jgi:TonB family protein
VRDDNLWTAVLEFGYHPQMSLTQRPMSLRTASIMKTLPVTLLLLLAGCSDSKSFEETVKDVTSKLTGDGGRWEYSEGSDAITNNKVYQALANIKGEQFDLFVDVSCNVGSEAELNIEFRTFDKDGEGAPIYQEGSRNIFYVNSDGVSETRSSQSRFSNVVSINETDFSHTESGELLSMLGNSVLPLQESLVIRIPLLSGEDTWTVPVSDAAPQKAIQACRAVFQEAAEDRARERAENRRKEKEEETRLAAERAAAENAAAAAAAADNTPELGSSGLIPPKPVEGANFFSDDDYPPEARAREAEGSTVYEYTVNSQGRVGACRIIQGSGEPGLDYVACRVATTRFRFQPATLNGSPTDYLVRSTVKFKLTN